MLLSMTGHGEAQRQQEGAVVRVEVRAVNNRFLKVSTRISEGFGALEPLIEATVRQNLRRGTIQVNVRVDREPRPDDFKLNVAALASYRQQLEALNQQAGLSEAVRLETLLALPGVVDENAWSDHHAEETWPLVASALVAALENLSRMRVDEGAAMAADLHANCETIAEELNQIVKQAPIVVEAYQRRLTERLNKLLADHEITLKPADVVREVGIFADRSDISEEIVRLRSHREQFESIANGEESNGRKLEFVIQEMFREVNTIGSKANDLEITQRVVAFKTELERIREQIQNVE